MKESKRVEETNDKELGSDLSYLMSRSEWRAVVILFERDLAKYDTIRGLTTEKEGLRRFERWVALDSLWQEMNELVDELKYRTEQGKNKGEEEA